MSTLEQALERLVTALDALEGAVAGGALVAPEAPASGDAAERIAALEAERDRLRAEVARLERQTEEDARLREEAAEAVRAALGDLRAVMAADQAAGEEAENG